MKAFLDTTVLVAAFIADHMHHDDSLNIFLKYGKRQTSCAAHSLAELYSTLTRMPGKHRVSAENAMLFLGEVRDHLTLVALDEVDYYRAIEHASARGVVGGTIYDALVANCARKIKAETIYTWNLRHFQQMEFSGRVRTPQ